MAQGHLVDFPLRALDKVFRPLMRQLWQIVLEGKSFRNANFSKLVTYKTFSVSQWTDLISFRSSR